MAVFEPNQRLQRMSRRRQLEAIAGVLFNAVDAAIGEEPGGV